ncbi:MAG: hypothetical protein ACK4SJ_00400 [Sphingorhabdus sp.]
MADGISSATHFLRDAVKAHLKASYDNPPIKEDEEVHAELGWKLTLHCPINNYVIVVEASEKVYPAIFRMRRAEMMQVQVPMAVYCACPEEAYLADQKEAQSLEKHGFGLFTVNAAGQVTKKFAAIPIVQHITENEFNEDIKHLPAPVRRMAKLSFETYRGNSPGGVASLSEVVEGMLMKAAKDAVKKSWISKNDAKGALANVIVKLKDASQLKNANVALSGAQTFVSRYRNATHHFPSNKKKAHIKYRDCRHGFLQGLRTLQELHDAMKTAGLSGSI